MRALLSYSFIFAAIISVQASGAVHDRITHAVDATRLGVVPHVTHADATEANDRGRVAGDLALEGVTVALAPSAEQQADLEQFLEAQRDPGSADFQNWLTPEQFGERFGVSESDLAKMASWFRMQGLVVEEVARGRNWIGLSGSAAEFERAFHTEIHRYASGQQMHFAPKTRLTLPEAFSALVAEVRGLSDFRLQPFRSRLRSISPDYTSTTSGAHYVAPDDLATIYGISGLYQAGFDGTGQTVAVVGQTDINLADIAAFRAKFNLPANVPTVQLFGPDPGLRKTDLPEAELDLEWIGSVARNANIIYVNSKNVITSVQNAINQNVAPVISMSYGGCEQQNSSSLRQLAQQANAQGITWVASSGDTGAAGCESGTASIATQGLSVNTPASIPEVTGIGGTTFNEGAQNFWAAMNNANGSSVLSAIPETAWNDTASRKELSASGGGASVFYAKPAWQAAANVPADGARDVPDISFAASPDHDGYLIYTNSALSVVGGTSVPTPIFAGVVGLLNQYLVAKGRAIRPGLGNINPKLYQLGQAGGVFQDVTTGDNIVPCTVGTKDCKTGSFGYSAGAGYDLVTGLGSANIYRLITSWPTTVASTGTTTTLTAAPAAIAQTASTQLTATVKAVSGAASPTGTVTFTEAGKTLGTASLTPGNNGSTASLAVTGSQLPLGTDTLSALYSGSTTFAASSGNAVITVSAPQPAPTGNSKVVATATPNVIAEQNQGWTVSLTLTEQAGQTTKFTTFTFNGTDYSANIVRFFGNSTIPAKGTLSAALRLTGLTAPTTGTFGFGGTDPNGHQWTQSVPVTFNPPAH